MKSTGEKARQAADSKHFEMAARAGFAVNGILHIAYAIICWKILSGDPSPTVQGGPLAQLAGTAAGAALLWIGAGSCLALSLWQLAKALLEKRTAELRVQLSHRGICAARSVVYVGLACTLVRFVLAPSASSGRSAHDITAALMGSPVGSTVLIAVGLGTLSVAAYCLYKGVGRKFLDDLRTTGPHHIGVVTRALGMAGYIARGIALGAVGLLIIVATIRSNPATAPGLDTALRALSQQPFGPYVVAGVGAGLFSYGIYSFARTKFAKM